MQMDITVMQPSLYELLKRLWSHISRRRRIQFAFAFLLTLSNAVAEVVSLGAVMPFLGVLVAPEKVLEYSFARRVAEYFGVTAPADLLLPFTVAFVVATIIAGVIRLLLLWSNNWLAYSCGSDLSLEMYRKTLYQPYQVHVARNSSEFNSNLAFKVNIAVEVLRQSLMFVSSAILLMSVFCLLLAVNVAATMFIFAAFGASYAVVGYAQQRKLASNAKQIASSSTRLMKISQEGLGGIRDVLLDGTQDYFSRLFGSFVYPYRKAVGNNQFMAASPRVVMEALGMVLIAAFAYSLSKGAHNPGTVLVLLGTIALGAQRMLPALQQLYSAWASIAGCKTSLMDALQYLEQPLPADAFMPVPSPLDFKQAIHLRRVSFRYSESSPWVLHGINLTIRKGTRVGFVGSTGSGKSTLLDILMGLMPPSSGEVLVDGIPIDETVRRAWQRNIAHVPQNIFLSDATIAENIAFGVPREEIDMARVRDAASKARIADFIEGDDAGYEAVVGERGIRLSGGQRQRIGIARALYKRSDVIIFDEATSALDNDTEHEVMQAIEGLDKDITVLIIAHRLTTLKNCTQIVELSDGGIKRIGTYQDIGI